MVLRLRDLKSVNSLVQETEFEFEEKLSVYL